MSTCRSTPFSTRLLAWVAGGAFVLATNYCLCEALSRHTHQDALGASHQHAPVGHHDEKVPASHTQSDPCCSTLQAVVTPQTGVMLSGASGPFFQDVPLLVVAHVKYADLSLAPSGLSPPARVPTPARPFYRTAFASHAPPGSLA